MSLKIRAITASENTKFIKSQWLFYKNDKNWVPPAIFDKKKLLNTHKNPFYHHADIQLFLAENNGNIVGRIAAITNKGHNDTFNDKVGFFGFFECYNDQEIANALFSKASEWLKERDKISMRGPMNPSMNDECGLLIEGFDSPPVILMTYNPPYYAQLIENAGFEKAKDLYAFKLEQETYRSEKLKRLSSIIQKRYNITIREINLKDKKQFRKDLNVIKGIYNETWEENWGFVKFTDEEIDYMAKDLKQIADPRYVYFIDMGDKPVGFMICLPDINQVLIYNKRGTLLGAIWNLLMKKKIIHTLRIIVLGVLPKYQGIGLDAIMYHEIGLRAIPNGIMDGEASWILEDNVKMIQALSRAMNTERYKTYRIYEKKI